MRRVHGRRVRVRVEGLGSLGFRVSAGCTILAAVVLSVRGWEEAKSRLFVHFVSMMWDCLSPLGAFCAPCQVLPFEGLERPWAKLALTRFWHGCGAP